MGRNRSKRGVLASDCPQRINKWLDKLRKLEKDRNSMLRDLKRPRATKITLSTSPDDSCEERIEIIKEALKTLKNELRQLEKDLGISRKQSKVFGGKWKRTNYQKLRGGK